MIIAQVEVLGRISERGALPKVLTRKVTHVVSGSFVAALLPLFPRHYWPARLAAAVLSSLYIVVFSAIAHASDAHLRALPPVLRRRIAAMGALPAALARGRRLAKPSTRAARHFFGS